MDRSNRIVFVTGAARGLGRAISERFIKNEDTVILADLDEKGLESTYREYADLMNVDRVKLDVGSYEGSAEVMAGIIKKYARIDVLVNNAGITADAQLINMTEEQFDDVIKVNLKGVFNCTKAVIPNMIENGYGKIINIASVVAHNGNFGQGNYAASKAGVIAMTKSWAKELGKKGINVNAVAPGYTMTEMVLKVPEKIIDKLKGKIPLKRFGRPDEIAEACFYLASDEASFVHGAVLNIDGGMVL